MEDSSGDNHIFIDDPLAFYLAEVANIPRLSRSEEIVCIQHVLAGDQEAESAAKRLVKAHLSLVVTMAEQQRLQDVHILDLIQAGNEGLLETLHTLGEHHQASFAELATPNIQSAIQRAIASPEQLRPIHRDNA